MYSKAILIYIAMVILIINNICFPVINGLGVPSGIWNGYALILICAYMIAKDQKWGSNKKRNKVDHEENGRYNKDGKRLLD
jgi:hypothetical protein